MHTTTSKLDNPRYWLGVARREQANAVLAKRAAHLNLWACRANRIGARMRSRSLLAVATWLGDQARADLDQVSFNLETTVDEWVPGGLS